MIPRASKIVAVVAAALLFAGPGRGLVGGHDIKWRHITAYFPSTVGVYETGDVLALDHPIGTVTDVRLEDTRVRVEMRIHDDVPLPRDVHATIEATTVLGERNITLFPSWNADLEAAGAPRLRDGAVIPIERTKVPVEPDEGLEAFNKLVSSLDPDLIGAVVTDSATIVNGRGKVIGSAIDSVARLSETLAAIDEPMLETARSLNKIAAVLNARGDQVRQLIDDFGTAVDTLAAERAGEQRLISGLLGLTNQASAILDVHGQRLPTTIATLVASLQVLAVNAKTVDVLVKVFPQVADSFQRAYRPELGGFFLKVNTLAVVDTVVRQLLDQLGVVPGNT